MIRKKTKGYSLSCRLYTEISKNNIMKARIFTLFIVLFNVCMIFGQATDLSNGYTYTAARIYSGSSIVIDANANEAVWSKPEVLWANQETVLFPPEGTPNFINGNLINPEGTWDLASKFKVLWDDQFVYLFIQVEDESFQGVPVESTPHQSDNIELFFNADPAKNYIDGTASMVRPFFNKSLPDYKKYTGAGYSVNNPNLATDTVGFRYAWRLSTTGYTVECKIPFKMIIPNPDVIPHPFDPEENKMIGFDVQTADCDDPARVNLKGASMARESIISWNSKVTTSFNNALSFGILKLGAPIEVSSVQKINDTKIEVYPSVATEKISISVSDPSKIKRISLLNALGQEMIANDIIQNRNEIPVQQLSKGMYFVSLRGVNGISETHKVIVK